MMNGSVEGQMGTVCSVDLSGSFQITLFATLGESGKNGPSTAAVSPEEALSSRYRALGS